jgi:succinyl-diaminopimelate desuccinylase
MQDEIELSQKLIKIPSFSGYNQESIEFIQDFLTKIGFECEILTFDGDNSYKVNNLHAIYNPKKSAKTLYFAGHTDVVATGDLKAWKYDPFEAKIVDGKLFGRGTSDMKCAIACFLQAVSEFLANNQPEFGIGFLITNDEENDSINGTKKVLEWMKNKGLAISACLVGEPTNDKEIGEMAKIGRRGSVNFALKITGKQGHVAYAHKAANPVTALVDILKMLKNHTFDEGNEFFVPTNLEITNIDSDNLGNNVIPNQASANFNVRFNSLHSCDDIVKIVEFACKQNANTLGYSYDLSYKSSGESFLSKKGKFSEITLAAIKKITNKNAVLGTTGGTSDARFIKDYCEEVLEFGLINETAHKIDEFANIDEIKKLKEIYLEILKNF